MTSNFLVTKEKKRTFNDPANRTPSNLNSGVQNSLTVSEESSNSSQTNFFKQTVWVYFFFCFFFRNEKQ